MHLSVQNIINKNKIWTYDTWKVVLYFEVKMKKKKTTGMNDAVGQN